MDREEDEYIGIKVLDTYCMDQRHEMKHIGTRN